MSKKVTALAITLLLSAPLYADTTEIAAPSFDAVETAPIETAPEITAPALDVESAPAEVETIAPTVAPEEIKMPSVEEFQAIVTDTVQQAEQVMPGSVPAEIKEIVDLAAAATPEETIVQPTDVPAPTTESTGSEAAAVSSEALAENAQTPAAEPTSTDSSVSAGAAAIATNTGNIDTNTIKKPSFLSKASEMFNKGVETTKTTICDTAKKTGSYFAKNSPKKNALIVAGVVTAAAAIYISYKLIKKSAAKRKANKNK